MCALPGAADLGEIQTPRLQLRYPRAGDGKAVHEAVVESLTELRAWGAALPWAMEEPSVAASESFCRQSQSACLQRTALVYLVWERDTQRLVGSASLYAVAGSAPIFELGYWCRTSLCGRGFMREAAAALLDIAFGTLGAQCVECVTQVRNHRSRHLCESLGMQLQAGSAEDWDAQSGSSAYFVYRLSRA